MSGNEDGTVRIYRQTANGSWERKEANIVHKDGVLSANFSPHGCHLVTASDNGVVKITELQSNNSSLAVIE
ncbi:hypothetical protein [Endozoicomonas sp. 8E]|uniref:hypothetical protein n=1 Tax=Endozoicomonas sp. 8E TaxID=3035692 RepID=UPI0029394FDF|nr:hypothetical protein [Endozoicomonas sp. 8E]WOG28324.1 hypothetical protein P6910_01340 [Endozoicomonas sp. 8E]